MTEQHIYDVLVVGAGPTGLACAIDLKRHGLDALVVDKGCLTNSLYNYPTHMTFFTTPELLEIGDIPMTSFAEKPTRTEALKYYRRVTDHYKLNVHQYESVQSIDGADGQFTIPTTDRLGRHQCYRARKVILSTGYYDIPNMLGVPGEDLPKVEHYYREAHPFYNHDVLVVGAKNSAAIAALELFWTGARVTMVHRGPSIHKHVKYWIKPNIENRIAAGEVKAYFNSNVVEIRPDSVVLSTPSGVVAIQNDFVLAMIGYSPDFTFLNDNGIFLDPATQKPPLHPETLESARKGVFLAGVIVAGTHTNEIFIENGRFHGHQIAKAIAEQLAP